MGLTMTSAEAIQNLVSRGLSKYAIAKSLGAFPVSVDHWLTGVKMSEKYRYKVEVLWGMHVDDTV